MADETATPTTESLETNAGDDGVLDTSADTLGDDLEAAVLSEILTDDPEIEGDGTEEAEVAETPDGPEAVEDDDDDEVDDPDAEQAENADEPASEAEDGVDEVEYAKAVAKLSEAGVNLQGLTPEDIVRFAGILPETAPKAETPEAPAEPETKDEPAPEPAKVNEEGRTALKEMGYSDGEIEAFAKLVTPGGQSSETVTALQEQVGKYEQVLGGVLNYLEDLQAKSIRGSMSEKYGDIVTDDTFTQVREKAAKIARAGGAKSLDDAYELAATLVFGDAIRAQVNQQTQKVNRAKDRSRAVVGQKPVATRRVVSDKDDYAARRAVEGADDATIRQELAELSA